MVTILVLCGGPAKLLTLNCPNLHYKYMATLIMGIGYGKTEMQNTNQQKLKEKPLTIP